MAEESSPNILVVDDTEAICSALRDLLTMNGYAVRTAPSGERALQIMESASMDLVITDLRMSGMSGLDLLKKVKQRTPSLPVVILTGFGDMDSVIEAMRSGVADYLKKPFSVNEVLEVVRRELKQARFVAPSALQAVEVAPDVAEPGQKPPRLYIFSPTDLAELEKALSELRAQVTAESVLLLEEAGYIISAKGTFSESDLPAVTSLIVSGRTTTAKLARMLGEEQAFALNYMEGQNVSVYTADLGKGLFLVLMVPKYVKQGAVWLYARKATSVIEKVAERALERAIEAAPSEPIGPSREELRHELSAQTENVFGGELEEEAGPPTPVQTLSFEDAMAQGLMSDMVDMMAREPEAELLEPVREAEVLPEEPPAYEPTETMSFEDAMKLGLLGDLGGAPAAEPEVAPLLDELPAVAPREMMSFEDAMKQGLLGDLVKAEEPLPAPEPSELEADFLLGDLPSIPEAELASFKEAMETGLPTDSEEALAAAQEEQPPGEVVETMSFEDAMEQGLLGEMGEKAEPSPEPEPPAPEAAPEPPPERKPAEGDLSEFLTFEEMLERGLLDNVDLGELPF